MPEIELPNNFRDNAAAATNAGYIVMSYMLHPSDKEARDTFVMASNTRFTQEVKNKLFKNKPELKTAEILDLADKRYLEPYFKLPKNQISFLSNIDASSTINKFADVGTQKEWRTTAFIAMTLIRISQHQPQLRGGASLKKATRFLETCKSKGLIPERVDIASNDTDMKKIWNKYKSVAHFMMPFWKMYSEGADSPYNMFAPSGLEGFLILSENIQKKLLSIKPKHGDKRSILEKNDLWLLPRQYTKIAEVQIGTPQFNQDELQILTEYRSA